MKKQRLNERQIRWSLILSRYNFILKFRPGSVNQKANILSRREQDIPQGQETEGRLFQLLKPEVLPRPGSPLTISVARLSEELELRGEEEENDPENDLESEDETEETLKDKDLPDYLQAAPPFPGDLELTKLWKEALQAEESKKKNSTYIGAFQALKNNEKRFPVRLSLKVSIAECDIDPRNRLRFRERIWVPDYEPLRTQLMQKTHDSSLSGHPGGNVTYSLLARRFFWPNITQDCRKFVRNCSMCGRTGFWREKKHGLLKPLPIPERLWAEISMDFITGLPKTDKGEETCLVITDRLSKGPIFISLTDSSAPAVAEAFLQLYVPYHGFPEAIVSDRGPQFVSLFWKRLCEILGITRRLSTAYHPETDGSTERMNQLLEAYLSIFCSYAQDDWARLLPGAAISIASKPNASTGFSPFFLNHGYEFNPIQSDEEPDSREPESEEPQEETDSSPVKRADQLIQRLKEASEIAQSAMAIAQEYQQIYANQKRQQAYSFQPGDKVWLNLKNYSTLRPSKKLDWKNAKFTVIKVISSHAYKLDTPPGIHPVFHVSLLKPANSDPFPSQTDDDIQPPSIQVDNQAEYEVEEILCARSKKWGRGQKRQVFVKWIGYRNPTWEPLGPFLDTVALDKFEAKYGSVDTNNGPLEKYDFQKKRRSR